MLKSEAVLLWFSAVAAGFKFSPPDCRTFQLPTLFIYGECFSDWASDAFLIFYPAVVDELLIVISGFLPTYVFSNDFKFLSRNLLLC